MLETDERDEPDGNLPPPAEGWGSQPGAGRDSGEVDRFSGEQGDLMFAIPRVGSALPSSEYAGRRESSSRGANPPTVGSRLGCGRGAAAGGIGLGGCGGVRTW
eukprot:scaffold126371_cov48-Phaeocystis_antarctica.AAC.1